jgi:hypothetical protein
MASARADLPLAVGPATISASGVEFVVTGITHSLWHLGGVAAGAIYPDQA